MKTTITLCFAVLFAGSAAAAADAQAHWKGTLSFPGTEMPIVVDVDNDGKSEVVIPEPNRDPALGLHFGSMFRVKEWGLVGYTMAYSRTLGCALHRLERYSHIMNEALHGELTVVDEVRPVRCFSAWRAQPRWQIHASNASGLPLASPPIRRNAASSPCSSW